MLLGSVTVLLMLGVMGYALLRWGVLRAFCACCNVLAAGLVAFNFFEPVAASLDPKLEGTSLHGCEDALCLAVLFAVTFGLLHLVTRLLARKRPDYHPGLQLGGAAVFGLLAGYLLAGFLLCVLDTLPLGPYFPGFQANIDPDARGVRLRRVLPPDRAWLALMHRAGLGPFARRGPTFDADGSFEFRYQRLRRQAGTVPAKAE
ncbi:MAG TPA: CvpA family protein [Gemmataceae bacterium]|nr:CvpA family protein [Gemmataceae bacterium]